MPSGRFPTAPTTVTAALISVSDRTVLVGRTLFYFFAKLLRRNFNISRWTDSRELCTTFVKTRKLFLELISNSRRHVAFERNVCGQRKKREKPQVYSLPIAFQYWGKAAIVENERGGDSFKRL